VNVEVGTGLIVIVYTSGVPTQPFNVGVIVIVPVIGAVVAFVAVNDGIVPVPLAARPIAVLEFVQANVAPVGVLTGVTAATEVAAHWEISVRGVITGVGLIVIVPVAGLLGHPATV
jgi:hypothetical protein